MGKVRRLGNEKERGGREMYSGKLAPHKSGTQSSKEEAVKSGRHADTRAHQTGQEGKEEELDGKIKKDV